jgi:FkbM family methyltransferase
MLIPCQDIIRILNEYKINITGVLHIGAHECEEMTIYQEMGISANNIIWLDAISKKVEEAKQRGIPNIYQAVVTDQDDVLTQFNISNNFQSSSILELGTHKTTYPDIVYTETFTSPSVTVDTFFERNNLDSSKHNFWNMDIQGAEYKALVGGEKSLKFAKVLYLEVNKQELYKGCALKPELDRYLDTQGFVCVSEIMYGNAGWGDALYIRK